MKSPPGPFRLKLAPEALATREALRTTQPARFKKLEKALRYLATNPNHTGLHAHKWDTLKGRAPGGGDIWTAYVENNTPAALRIFYFFDAQEKGVIAVTAIRHHT